MASPVARRYARALADILFAARLPAAALRGELQHTKQHLGDFAALLRQHAPLRAALTSPAVAKEQRLALLDRLRSLLGLSELTRNFLAVLLDHRRLELLPQVLGAFDTEVYARLGVVLVEVTTALELNAKQKKLLEERLAALTGAQVEMRFQQNPEVLGGVVARLGSTIYDGSLRAQLRRLQQQLSAEAH